MAPDSIIDICRKNKLNENENFEDLRDAALCGSDNKTSQLLNETIIDGEKAFFYLSNI